MEFHGAALDQRLEDVALEGLDGDDDAERPQRCAEPAVGEGDQHGDRPGEEGPDERDVGAHEDQRTEPGRAGDPEDEQADGDGEGVDQGDQRGTAHEAGHRVEGPLGAQDGGLRAAGRQVGADDLAGAVAVAEEEEDQGEGQHAPGGDLGGQAQAGEHTVGDGRDERIGLALGVGQDVPDLLADRPEPVGDPVARLRERVGDLRGAVHQRVDEQGDHPADGGDQDGAGQPGGDRTAEPAPDHPRHHRVEQRGAEQRQDDRYGRGPQFDQGEDDQRGDGDEQHDRRGPGGCRPERGRQHEVGAAVVDRPRLGWVLARHPFLPSSAFRPGRAIGPGVAPSQQMIRSNARCAAAARGLDRLKPAHRCGYRAITVEPPQ